MEKFHEITNIYDMQEKDEKIEDVAGGRNFIIVVTNKGNVYASGSSFYGSISGSIVSNKLNDSSHPYKIAMDSEWKAIKCWANDLY
jgi:alpha-tubulin suppressor-like RCC1 family protein